MNTNGRLAIIELEVDGDDSSGFETAMNLAMLTLLNGRERTLKEYTSLLAEAGFIVTNVNRVRSEFYGFYVIEAAASKAL